MTAREVSFARLTGEPALREAWTVLGRAYEPPLWERMGDYDGYVAKVAANAVTLVAESGGGVLGGVSFYANDAEGGEGFITQLMVAPGAQGMGLGTRLVAECEVFCREAGMRTLALEVRADNDGARHLYERLGFAEFGRTSRGSLMRKAIPPEQGE